MSVRVSCRAALPATLVVLAVGVGALVVVAPAAAASGCRPTTVRYAPYVGGGPGLRSIPWIAATHRRSRLVGHLFYYDGANAWKRRRLPRLRIYSGGESPDGRVAMKILWVLRGAGAAVLRIEGTRLDGPGFFAQRLPSAGAGQFPSIVDVPTPGCWRLALKARKTRGQVVMLAVGSR